MHITTKYSIHHPSFQVCTLNAADGAVILHTQKQFSALKIEQRDNLFRQLLRAQVVALELDAGVFTIGDNFQ